MRVAEKQSGPIRVKRTNRKGGHSLQGLIRFSCDIAARELKTRQCGYAFAQLTRGRNRKQLSHAATIAVFVTR